MVWLVMRYMAAETLMPAKVCFFHALLSVAVIKHFFCYGDAIPLLGPWEFRLVTPVQDNEHQVFIPSLVAQMQCQNKLGVCFNYVMNMKANALHSRCFKGDLTTEQMP